MTAMTSWHRQAPERQGGHSAAGHAAAGPREGGIPGAVYPADEQLLESVRNGDAAAYAALWSRHVGAARLLAQRIAPASDVDDLISEAYTRVLAVLRAGDGPTSSFRAYLLSTLRRANIDMGRRYRQRVLPTGVDQLPEAHMAPSSEELAVEHHQHVLAWQAWLALPEETKRLLWQLVVEEEAPAQLAAQTGVSPNAVASRGKRARERLRQAFLSQSVASGVDDACREVRNAMGPHARGQLPAASARLFGQHTRDCDPCARAWRSVVEVAQAMPSRHPSGAPVIAFGQV